MDKVCNGNSFLTMRYLGAVLFHKAFGDTLVFFTEIKEDRDTSNAA